MRKVIACLGGVYLHMGLPVVLDDSFESRDKDKTVPMVERLAVRVTVNTT